LSSDLYGFEQRIFLKEKSKLHPGKQISNNMQGSKERLEHQLRNNYGFKIPPQLLTSFTYDNMTLVGIKKTRLSGLL
jgi:hypothetical protein